MDIGVDAIDVDVEFTVFTVTTHGILSFLTGETKHMPPCPVCPPPSLMFQHPFISVATNYPLNEEDQGLRSSLVPNVIE